MYTTPPSLFIMALLGLSNFFHPHRAMNIVLRGPVVFLVSPSPSTPFHSYLGQVIFLYHQE